MSTNDEYSYDEADLAGTGGGKVHPPKDYTTKIVKAEVAKDKNQRPYLLLQLEVRAGSEKGEILYDNYLPFGREKSGKRAGLPNLRTASFLKAIGHKQGVPPGAPGGADASTLVGTIVSVHNDNEYDVPGDQYPVRTWEKKFKEYQAAGKLEGIKPKDSLGFYSLDDDFEGIGDGSSDSSAADADGWG